MYLTSGHAMNENVCNIAKICKNNIANSVIREIKILNQIPIFFAKIIILCKKLANYLFFAQYKKKFAKYCKNLQEI